MSNTLTVKCVKCGKSILQESELCVYVDNNASFLILKPECSLPTLIKEYPSTSKNKYIVGELCCLCGEKIGNVIPKGPDDVKVYNFAFSKEIQIPGFSFLVKTNKKKGTKATELIPTFPNLQQRDRVNFSGQRTTVQEFKNVPTIFPTIEEGKELLKESPAFHKRLRDYQQEMYYCGVANDCVINLPTGSGKTYIAFYLLYLFYRKNQNKSILFLTPVVELVKQQFTNLKMEVNDNNSIPSHKIYKKHGNFSKQGNLFLENGGILFATDRKSVV